jgi:hypothetical protein
MEDGDGTRVRRGRYPFELQPRVRWALANIPHRNALGERRDQGRARSLVHSPTSVAATTRRSSANAPQRTGVSRWKVAMGALARRGCYSFDGVTWVKYSAAYRLHRPNYARLIGERDATRGRIAVEGGRERAGVKMASIQLDQSSWRSGSDGGSLEPVSAAVKFPVCVFSVK